MSSDSIIEVLNDSDTFLGWIFEDASAVHVAHVFTPGDERSKAMDAVLLSLHGLYPGSSFGKVCVLDYTTRNAA